MADPHGESLSAPESFPRLVDALEDYAIILLDPSGHVASWNPGAERIKGYSESEILGRHFSVFYTEEDEDDGTPEEVLETAAREGEWTGRGWRVREDGRRFRADVTVTALRNDDGTLRGFAKVTRDITEQYRREVKLQRERQRAERATERAQQENRLLRLMQQVAATANRAESLARAMKKAIPAICRHTGWPVGHVYRMTSERELVPTGIWSVQDGEDFDGLVSATEDSTFAVGEGLPGTVTARGAPVWIQNVAEAPGFLRTNTPTDIGVRGAFAFPIRLAGETVAVLEFFSRREEEPDEQLLQAMESVGVQLSRVAERAQARQELRESEAKFRALADQSLIGIELIQDGVYTYVNPTFAEYFGYEPEDLVGASPEMIIHPDDWPRVKELIRQRLEGKKTDAQFLTRGQTRDGKTVYLEATGRRVEYDGRPAIVGGSLDVTEKRRLEEELIDMRDEEKRRMGRELHDGVAPLLAAASMMTRGLSEQVERGASPDVEEFDRVAGYIQDAADEIRALSHGLSPPGLDLGLAMALDDFVSQIEGRSELSFTLDVDDAVSDLSETLATQLYRIAQEAVNNAVQHADAEQISIRLAWDEDNGAVVLAVEDDGRGLDETKAREGGLGLRTMRRRANLLNGKLTIEEVPGGGTLVECQVCSATS